MLFETQFGIKLLYFSLIGLYTFTSENVLFALMLFFFSESEPSLLEFKPFSNGPLVGGFIYRGCQSERLYGSYVFGDRNGYVSQCHSFLYCLAHYQNIFKQLWPAGQTLDTRKCYDFLCFVASGSLIEEMLRKTFFSRLHQFYGTMFEGKAVL